MSSEDAFHPEVKQIPFEFNKPGESSAKPKKTYRILVVSDLHLGYIVHSEMLKQYVGFMNDLHPDIVVIDGDLVDYTLRPLITGKMDDELRKIKAPKGVFFIPGNHEYKFNSELKLDWISRAGLTVLKDSVANIDHCLYLIGRDDRSNKNRLRIEELISKVDPTKPCIFLAHQPGDIRDAYRYGIPLTVCGHTHGGQVFPMNLISRFLYTNSYGLQKKGKSYSYTTSGLGLSGFPMRIGSHSEGIIFNIEIY
jgi:predicted MPP superfamily phosphohydrolase